MFAISCTFIGLFLIILGSSGNGLCILVFLRKKFRHRRITPYFIILLFADSIYLLFRLIKLFYYSQTLFKLNTNSKESCSNTLLARIYQHASQTWPQPLVPLVHSETYMRFSLILMSIISLDRTILISRSLKCPVLPPILKQTHKYKWTFLFIIVTFLLAYILEFAGLTLFCSKSNNRDLSYQWFIYMSKYMENSTNLLINTMNNQPDSLKCVNYILTNLQQRNQTEIIYENAICTKEQLMNIIAHYFDKHERSIVSLIQKILFHQTGQRITRNEIRRKFHFHECLFRQEPNFFHQYYNFMYSRIFGFNRHTLILVFGSVLPSLITIISNIVCVYRVRELNRLTSNHILPSRRRTDDTRRVLIVITVECLFAIINSWFSDIFLSLVYCKRKLLADDDCPMFLRQNYGLLVMLDMFNSISNIILHCLCGKRFRNELRSMFQSCFEILKQFFSGIWCCYFQIHMSRYNPEQYVYYNASVTRNESSNSHNSLCNNHLYLQPAKPRRPLRTHFCDCQLYFNQQPLAVFRRCLSVFSKNSIPLSTRYQSLTQRTQVTKSMQNNTMRLYYPQQQTTPSSGNRTWFSWFR